MRNNIKVLINGIIKENPFSYFYWGCAPPLATTSSALNGMSMGLATLFVLTCSNIAISLLKNLIPDMVRIPAFIVIIATFVTIVQMLMNAYLPSLADTLGIFIPLIVVNCIVLGRAESFASKNNVIPSLFDGLGIGIGFTLALTILGSLREFLGTGKIFSMTVYPENYGSLIFVLAPGAFIVLGYLIAIFQQIAKENEITPSKKEKYGNYRIIIVAIFVNNIVFSQFLGICPFLGVSKKIDTAIGMSAAVTFVITLSTLVTYLIQKGILENFGLEYLQTITFILVIAHWYKWLKSS